MKIANSWMVPTVVPIGPWFVCAMAWLALSSFASAQLTILSEGNKQSQWRKSQIDALRKQLSEPKIENELKRELQSQLKWLSAWKPGALNDEPLWPSERKVEELWQEPSIDPAGIATDLRQRLLGERAQPTVEDTRELERMLVDYSGDLGVRQLHLHWLDQPQYRKDYPSEIAEAASKVLTLLDKVAKPVKKIELARAFCLYRRGRALSYRELPDVLNQFPMNAEERERNNAELVGVYRQLKNGVAEHRPEFILLDIRMLRADHWNGRGLALLEDYASQITPQWFLRNRRDILRDLGWEGPAKEAADVYAVAFPKQVAQEAE